MAKIAKLAEIQRLFDNLGIIAAEDYSPTFAETFIRQQAAQSDKMAMIADIKPE